MKKLFCMFLCLLCLTPLTACGRKDVSAPRVWCIKPSTISAETELKQMIRNFDSSAYISFVPAKEMNIRLKSAMEKGEGPDVFMMFAESLPDLAEDKKLLDITDRLRLGKIKSDEQRDAARRACIYQTRNWGVPLFTDVYMLATNRALVAEAPSTVAELKAAAIELEEKQLSSFEKLSPEKKSLLFEASLSEHGGKMLNAMKTDLEFNSEAGQAALGDCVRILKSEDKQQDAMGEGKAAFSVMTMIERKSAAEKYPDAEIALSPLFGLNRLQTVALAINGDTKNQARSYDLLEFLETKANDIAALYKCYTANKDLTPIDTADKDAVTNLTEARPAPDLCGYESLESVYLPTAIDKASKGVNYADCLAEAAEQAAGNIWKGKRE